MRNIDISRLIKLALAGAVAGLLIFCMFESSSRAAESGSLRLRQIGDVAEMIGQVFRAALVLGLAIGATFGGIITLVDGIGSPPRRLAVSVGQALGAGFLIGAFAGLLGQLVFSVAGMALIVGPMGLFIVILGRGAGWAIIGAGAGSAVGFALGSWSRARACIIGGLVGGGIGGLLFDVISLVTGTGTLSRFVGFIVMGAAIGAAVAWVEDLVKQCWVTILSGPKEGKSYILSKPVTTIGRDELADIPFFGDTSVAKQHAVLQLTHPLITVQSVHNSPLLVNGAHTLGTQLKDSDIIQVGRYAMRFHQKATQHVGYLAHQQMGPPYSSPQPSPCHQPQSPYAQPQPTAYGTPQPTVSQPAATAATGTITLTAASGPHASQSFRIGPGNVKIGRESDCGVLLAQDTLVSRNHAELGWDGRAWWIRDLGSRNGTYVNGVVVSQQMLNPGDQVSLGQTVLRVEGV